MIKYDHMITITVNIDTYTCFNCLSHSLLVCESNPIGTHLMNEGRSFQIQFS